MKLKIDDDEMVECMRERLSDDLWERYGEVEKMLSAEDKFYEEVKNGSKDWQNTKEATNLLISIWKKDIEVFKQRCKLLGHTEKDIEKVVKEIMKKGYMYLGVKE